MWPCVANVAKTRLEDPPDKNKVSGRSRTHTHPNTAGARQKFKP